MRKYDKRGKYGLRVINLFAKRTIHPVHKKLIQSFKKSEFFKKKMAAFYATSKGFRDTEDTVFDFRREIEISFRETFPVGSFYV